MKNINQSNNVIVSKYEKYSKEQLIKHIYELEEQLKSSKYGLYWDKSIEKEKVVQELIYSIPVLDYFTSIITDNDAVNHLLLEGDNYHALTILNYIFANKIDLIYIDPPYFTGNKDFIYNDNFVDKEDGFKHSKWLTMMDHRLRLAKELLKEDGMIFISIDDNEQANLKLLCDSIFGEQNFISQFIIDKTAQGANQSDTFKTQHEYCLLYVKSSKSNIDYEVVQETNLKKYKYRDKKGLYAITNRFDSINSPLILNKNRGYTVYYNPMTKDAIVKDEYIKEINKFNNFDEKLLSDGYIPIRPGVRKGVQYPWNWSSDRFLAEYKEELVFSKNKTDVWVINHKNRLTGKVKDTTLKRFDTRKLGNQILVDIIGDKKFDYPKSIDMMKWVISKHFSKSAVVLDFFAGSGTTGHALLKLNEEDGGNRKFILCTNNENNICKDVTYPRLKTVITGKREDGSNYSNGIHANLHYYKCSLIPNAGSTDQAKYNLVEKVNHLLCIAENAYELVESSTKYYIYQNSGENKQIFLYIDYYDLNFFEKFKSKIISSKMRNKIVYMFSTDNIVDEFLFKGIQGIELKPIPSKIYEIYKEIVEDIKRE